jgi:DNA-binding transcriptional regulator YiaG
MIWATAITWIKWENPPSGGKCRNIHGADMGPDNSHRFPSITARCAGLLTIGKIIGRRMMYRFLNETLPYEMTDDERLTALEHDEPKRRLLRDANALRKQRGITQAAMAEELDISRRTLEEWLQGRRYPKGPGMTLIRRWVNQHQKATPSI